MTAPPPSSSIPPPVGTPHPPGQGQPGPAGYPAAPPPGQAPSWSPPPPQPPPQTWAEIPMRPGAYQQPAPVPGVPVVPPLIPPQTGQMVVGWEVFKPRPGCFHCVGLSFTGWLSVFILLICFWPLAWSKYFCRSCPDLLNYCVLLYCIVFYSIRSRSRCISV